MKCGDMRKGIQVGFMSVANYNLKNEQVTTVCFCGSVSSVVVLKAGARVKKSLIF